MLATLRYWWRTSPTARVGVLGGVAIGVGSVVTLLVQPQWLPAVSVGLTLIVLVGLVASGLFPRRSESGHAEDLGKSGEEKALLPQAGVAFPDRWAVVVGVNEYRLKLPKLNWCANDAKEFAQLLRDDLDFPDDHVLEFHDEAETPDLSLLIQYTGEFVDRVQPDDLLLFFFSGHGIVDNGKDFLLPASAAKQDLEKTGLGVKYLTSKLLKRTGCRNVVLFLDACRNLGDELAIATPRSASSRSIGADSAKVAKREGTVIFFSCQTYEESWEIPDLKHGAFTHCLLKGIKEGHAVTVERLDQYLAAEVPTVFSEWRHKYPNMKPQQPHATVQPPSNAQLPLFDLVARSEAQLLDLFPKVAVQKDLDLEFSQKAFDFLRAQAKGVHVAASAKRLALVKEYTKGAMHNDFFIANWKQLDSATRSPGTEVPLTVPHGA